MVPQLPGRPRSTLPLSMPDIERIRRAAKRLEGVGRVEQPLIGSGPRVFTHQLETEVAGEDPSSSPRPPDRSAHADLAESSAPIDSSESCVHDRRFRLSDPTATQTSSTTNIFA